jgi:hypothetical protein
MFETDVEGLLLLWHKVQQMACCGAVTPFTFRNIIIPFTLPPTAEKADHEAKSTNTPAP